MKIEPIELYPGVHYDLMVKASSSVRGSVIRLSVIGYLSETAISQLVVLLAGETDYRFSFPAPDQKVKIQIAIIQEKAPVSIQSLSLTGSITSFAPGIVFRVLDNFTNVWADLPIESLESGRYSLQALGSSETVELTMVIITEPTGTLITANYVDPSNKRSSACADYVNYHGDSPLPSRYYTLVTPKSCVVSTTEGFLSQTYSIEDFRTYLDRRNLAYLIN